MSEKVILFFGANTATAQGNGPTYGKVGLFNGILAVALTLNMTLPSSSAASTAGRGIPSPPITHTQVDASQPSTIRSRRKGQTGESVIGTIDQTNINQISGVSLAINHMSTLLNKVDSFAHLEDGWNGYDSDAPDEATIKNAIAFLSELPNTFVNNLSEHNLTPTCYGTINIEFSLPSDDFVAVEIGHEAIAYFYEIKGKKGESLENIKIGSENYSGGIYSALNSLYTPIQA